MALGGPVHQGFELHTIQNPYFTAGTFEMDFFRLGM